MTKVRVPWLPPAGALLALSIAVALIVFHPSNAAAEDDEDESDYGPIVTAALQYEGQYEGECFPWVRRVVREVGHPMGFGYHEGYLEGGAEEISGDEARAGDVVQLAAATESDSSASYPGLHTAIIMENHDDGTYRVIDSNSQWAGIVRVREGYNPEESAARYDDITARYYRFPDEPLGVESVSTVSFNPAPDTTVEEPAPRDEPLEPGTEAVVRGDGDCLRMRDEPGLDGERLDCIDDGSTVTVLEGAEEADGYRWQRVEANGQTGWMADQYLDPLSSDRDDDNGDTSGDTSDDETDDAFSSEPVPGPAGNTTGATASGSLRSGEVPAGGGVALVIWSGGTVHQLAGVVSDEGCNLTSTWANRSGGGLIGHIANAPVFVNLEWDQHFPGGLIPEYSPLLIVCVAS